MERSYASVQAGDLFAYTLVDFIVNTYGQAALNRLIRAPESLQDILGVTPSEFEQRWRQYMSEHYASQ
ncbi:MAG: hypothetical protein IPO81_05550 [Kouleothrix sp.]|nr:hypothetical protein [Kouleothrix sp.]